MASRSQRSIPEGVKREVRRRCGFGCVICGMPLFDYDHILGWAKVRRHVANEITLLCDQHHREKTAGLLPASFVVAADRDPFNRRNGRSKPYELHYSSPQCEIVVGSNCFIADARHGGTICAVSIDETQLVAFRIEEEVLLLHAEFYDESNQRVLQVLDNQLSYSLSPWDIEFVGRRLILREGSRRLLLDMTFEVPDRIVINQGRFLRNGVEVLVRPDELLISNNGLRWSESRMQGCRIGIAIGPHPDGTKCMIRAQDVPRNRVFGREQNQ